MPKSSKPSPEKFTDKGEWLHSPVGPSSADRWMNCPGSVLLTKDMEDKSSTYAIEGTAAHYLAEKCAAEGVPAEHHLYNMIKVEDNGTKYGIVCSQEMAEAVQEFLDYCDAVQGDRYYESLLHYTDWVENGFGTADFISIKDGEACVVDLKYGKGIQVYAENNAQLKLYALGVLFEKGFLYEIDSFRLVIHQPRLNHVDETFIGTDELLKWADEEVAKAGKLAQTPGAPFAAGSWCRFCLASNTCKTKAKKAFDTCIGDFEDLCAETPVEAKDPNELTLEEIGLLLPFGPFFKKFAEELEHHALSEIGKGKVIPHPVTGDYKMVEGRSDRAWKNGLQRDGEDQEDAVKRNLRRLKVKVADMYTHKIKGPAGIEKLLGKKNEKLNELIMKPAGKPKLAPGTDKRASIQIKVEEEFDDISGEVEEE